MLEFYSTYASRAMPIQQARYHFPIPPDRMDSDHDGVPDYVEIAKGLNPVTSRNDADHDGYSDLHELLAGTNPNSAASFPSVGSSRPDIHNSFDLFRTPRPWDGSANATSLAAVGGQWRGYGLDGRLLGAGATASYGATDVRDPALRLSGLPLDAPLSLVVVASESHFEIQTTNSDRRIGRELLGIVKVPSPDASVRYQYSGADLTKEAEGWLTAARSTYGSQTHLVSKGEIDVDDTLLALLLEQNIRNLVAGRDTNNSNVNLTLFPFRPADAGRSASDALALADLQREVDPSRPGYRLEAIFDGLNRALRESPGNSELKLLTRDLYRISSRFNNAQPGAFQLPVDELRLFLESGGLDGAYQKATALSSTQIDAARAQAAVLMRIYSPRPMMTLNLVVRPESFSDACTILYSTADGRAWSLLGLAGGAYRPAQAIALRPGTQLQALGYADVSVQPCASNGLQVVQAQLLSAPIGTSRDVDADGLPDASEMAWFGNLSQSGTNDSDGDGATNLQEFQAGTDPADPSSRPGGQGQVPALVVTAASTSTLSVTYTVPPDLVGLVQLKLYTSDQLDSSFKDAAVTPVDLGNGQYQLSFPIAQEGYRFFYVVLVPQ